MDGQEHINEPTDTADLSADTDTDSTVAADQVPPETGNSDPRPEVATAPDTDTADGVADYTPGQGKVAFTETMPCTQPLDKDVGLAEVVQLFRESYTTVNAVLERSNDLLEKINKREDAAVAKLRNQGKPLTDDDGSAWFRTVMNALAHAQIDATGEASLTRDGSSWEQVLDYEGKALRAGQPKQKLSGKHSAEERLTYIARKAGVGTVFDVPLYHSGLWVRFKTPPLSALTGLQYQLNQLKVTLGSDSKGMAFSNTAQALTSAAVDFALQYVIEANVHHTTPSDLKERIKLLDVPILLWGLAVTLYPKGFPYAHPCVADPETCQNVVKETLNLNRLFWTDAVSLTATQRKMMARRFDSKLSDEELQLYQTEHVRGGNRLVWFGDIGLTLKVPNVQEFEEAGRSWIEGIIGMTQGAFNEPPHGSNRDQYITRLGMSTTARQYAHWVVAVYEKDDDGNEELISDDTDVINETLNHIFSTDDYAEDFFTAVSKYKDDAIISMIAVPSFNCPSCNSPAATLFHERFAHLVPLDVLTTFFTLVNRKHN